MSARGLGLLSVVVAPLGATAQQQVLRSLVSRSSSTRAPPNNNIPPPPKKRSKGRYRTSVSFFPRSLLILDVEILPKRNERGRSHLKYVVSGPLIIGRSHPVYRRSFTPATSDEGNSSVQATAGRPPPMLSKQEGISRRTAPFSNLIVLRR